MTVHKQNFTSGITKELSPKKKKKELLKNSDYIQYLPHPAYSE